MSDWRRGKWAPWGAAALTLALAGCGDESVARYAGEGPWRLERLDGAAFPARATLSFPGPGEVAGQGPCNGYSASQSVPYPWFEIGPIASTRMACPDLAAESAYFAALGEMTLAEASGETLLLSNEAGREMLFRLAEDGADGG